MKSFANILLSLLLLSPMVTLASPETETPVEAEIKELQSARLVVLRKLFREVAGSQQVLESSKGYAVFFRAGLDLGLVSSRRDAGILRNNRMGRDSYYNVVNTDGSDGAKREDIAVVYVFQSSEALDQFEAQGWDPATQSPVNPGSVAPAGDTEAGTAAMPGAMVYQLSETGIALQNVRLIRNQRLN